MTHIKGIVADAQRSGSLKEAVEHMHIKHGIENIDVLFPDARSVTDTPEFDQRRVEWVSGVMNGTKHSPFSRIKSLVADITFDEARARGYIKGNLKKEEWFGVSKRSHDASTVYKKQKLDRDDIIDITDFDVVMWLKAEMRLMLDEELARAILIGDGRDVDDDDKIKDPVGALEGAGIRSILHDHDLYVATVTVDDSADATGMLSMGLFRLWGSIRDRVLRLSIRLFRCLRRLLAHARSLLVIVCGRLRRSLLRRWVFLPSLLSKSWKREDGSCRYYRESEGLHDWCR